MQILRTKPCVLSCCSSCGHCEKRCKNLNANLATLFSKLAYYLAFRATDLRELQAKLAWLASLRWAGLNRM